MRDRECHVRTDDQSVARRILSGEDCGGRDNDYNRHQTHIRREPWENVAGVEVADAFCELSETDHDAYIAFLDAEMTNTRPYSITNHHCNHFVLRCLQWLKRRSSRRSKFREVREKKKRRNHIVQRDRHICLVDLIKAPELLAICPGLPCSKGKVL